MACPNITARRTTPPPENYAQHQCSLVAQTTGATRVWISDAQSADCNGDDLTSSTCAKAINYLLTARVVRNWQQPDAGGCAGSLSLDQAFALILSRQGAGVAEQVVLAAVASGMPESQAVALAQAHGLDLSSSSESSSEGSPS